MSVTVRNIVTGETAEVDDEVARVIANQKPPGDWRVDKDAQVAELQARIDQLEQEKADLEADLDGDDESGLPKRAGDVIAWIGEDHNRALAAKAAETDRKTTRKTVMDHIESVLNPQEA